MKYRRDPDPKKFISELVDQHVNRLTATNERDGGIWISRVQFLAVARAYEKSDRVPALQMRGVTIRPFDLIEGIGDRTCIF